MTIAETPGRRERTPLEETFRAFSDLIPRLDRLADAAEGQLERSSELISLFRGVQDGLLVSGMWQVTQSYSGAPLQATFDFDVPFASIMVADPNGAGPLTINNGGTGESLGAGALQMNLNDVASVPFRGRHLTVIATVANKPFFLAVSTKVMPPYWGKC